MKPNHKCDPARMALLYIRQQFICTTFKFDAYDIFVKEVLSFIMKKHVNFLKEVVSFLKKLLVSRKRKMSSMYIM